MDVSVIIPTYNRLWCLPEAIASCRPTQCQTEIIVVDDGSTDGTWEWLQTRPDVVSLYQSHQGKPWGVNRAMQLAQGRYIRILDSDDLLCPGTIDRQFNAAIATNADLVYSQVNALEKATGHIIEHPELPLWDDFLAVQLGEGDGSHFLGMLFRRELVEQVPHRPDFAYRDDRLFLLEIGLLNPQLTHVPGCAGYWVRHEQQMQANYRGLQSVVANWQHLTLYQKILGELSDRGDLTPRRARAACNVLWSLAHWIAYTHPAEAQAVVDWIYCLAPEFQPPESGLLGKFYRFLGFTMTEQILRYRRTLLRPFQAVTSSTLLHFPT
ncbi:MAG: glycosyltransferase family 2 protein [Oculatellaceae cyanobacterium bins.114]|nr:glycosyltransferase family 2 protein [Oculatellaceae cyanobacterium bins.114]